MPEHGVLEHALQWRSQRDPTGGKARSHRCGGWIFGAFSWSSEAPQIDRSSHHGLREGAISLQGYLLSRDSDPASVASDQSTHVNPASSLCVLDVWSSPSDVGDHGPGAVLALTRRTSPDWHML